MLRFILAERPNLKHRSEVQSLHNHFLDAFAQEVAKNHPSNSGRILIDVFRILPHLRYLNRLSQQSSAPEGGKRSSSSSSSPSTSSPAPPPSSLPPPQPAATSGMPASTSGTESASGQRATGGGGGGDSDGASTRGLNMVPPSPSGSESSGMGLPTHHSGTAGAT